MRVEIIVVPYDSGVRDVRMGRGPDRLLPELVSACDALDVNVTITRIEAREILFPAEIAVAFELQRAVSIAVADARSLGSFPVVLSGNCNVAVGTVSGISSTASTPSVCWLDAHGDLNTPETTVGGFLDGMALAMLTGRCWRAMTAQVPGFAPVPDSRVVMIGTRDLDPRERELLEASGIHVARSVSEPVIGTILTGDGCEPYVHVDLDSLDPSEGRANGYAVGGGLYRDELQQLVTRIGAETRVAALAFSAYDPDHDPEGRIARVARDAATAVLATQLNRY